MDHLSNLIQLSMEAALNPCLAERQWPQKAADMNPNWDAKTTLTQPSIRKVKKTIHIYIYNMQCMYLYIYIYVCVCIYNYICV